MELSKQVGACPSRPDDGELYLADRDHDPKYVGGTSRIANELADILYCVIRLADHFEVDLEEARLSARSAEWNYLHPRATPPWTTPTHP